MITKDQYEFFKLIYAEHLERRKSLETRAQLYFTIQSLYFGVVILKFGEIFGAGKAEPNFVQISPVYQAFQAVAATFLACAICWTLWSIRIRDYQTITNPEDVARDLLDERLEPMTNEEFIKRRIVDLSIAANWNAAKNLESAGNLRWACWFMIAAVITHLCFVLTVSIPSFPLAVAEYASSKSIGGFRTVLWIILFVLALTAVFLVNRRRAKTRGKGGQAK
jgi:hypothetical protein